jgi:hypothetical protein
MNDLMDYSSTKHIGPLGKSALCFQFLLIEPYIFP